ncbi:hypothetical protein F0562_000930 [Nyssa sinensis]|uniref:Uncharacterized protein n=1 Tax=Nyssa sinensis TaxID=561372 RepID=A0A5J5C2U4_9ASTE|nr:hypothetical protein F0562_000930 [Nyssa sinensis]
MELPVAQRIARPSSKESPEIPQQSHRRPNLKSLRQTLDRANQLGSFRCFHYYRIKLIQVDAHRSFI